MYQEIFFTSLFLAALAVLFELRKRALNHLSSDKTHSLVTIGRAAASVFHDLNNLLQIIGGNLELLSYGCDSAEIRDRLNRIEQAYICATRLNRQALGIVTGHDQSILFTDIRTHVRDLRVVLECLAGSGVRLSLRINSDLNGALLKQSQVDQIFINLIVNSREAGASEIDIELVNKSHTSSAHAGQSNQPSLLIRATDNGRGFSEGARKQAIKEFYSEGKISGTGIGLSTINSIVRNLGGELTIDNAELGGAVVTVEIPVSA